MAETLHHPTPIFLGVITIKHETQLQNDIRLGVADIAITFRANVGTFKTEDGRFVTTGLPPGFSDLFGFNLKDGKMFFIEVKTERGRLSARQRQFLSAMQAHGCRAGVARSVEEARRIIQADGPT